MGGRPVPQRYRPVGELCDTFVTSSSRRGGSAPARQQVIAATRHANVGGSLDLVEPAQVGAAEARAAHRARKAPMNASPAPIVSTTSTRGAATATRRVGGDHQRALAAERDERDQRVRVAEQRARRVDRLGAGIEPGQVLLADLDDVRARQQPAQPPAVRGGVARSCVGRQFGSSGDERVVGQPRDERLEASWPSARTPGRACPR